MWLLTSSTLVLKLHVINFLRVVCDFYHSEDSWFTSMNSFLKFILVIQIIQNRISSRKFKPLLKKSRFLTQLLFPEVTAVFTLLSFQNFSLLKKYVHICLYTALFLYVANILLCIKFIIFYCYTWNFPMIFAFVIKGVLDDPLHFLLG